MTRWKPTADPSWILEQEGFDPSREREMESLFTIGNGFFGVRGSTEILMPTSQADLFISGVYDQKIKGRPYIEPELISFEQGLNSDSELVPFPFPFRIEVFINGKPLDILSKDLVQHSRKLDFKQGLFFQNYQFVDQKNRRIAIKTMRCASLTDPHLLLREIEIKSENYFGDIDLIISMNPFEKELCYPHLTSIDVEGLGPESEPISQIVTYQTLKSGIYTTFASRILFHGESIRGTRATLSVSPEKTILLRQYISSFYSAHLEEPLNRSIHSIQSLSWKDFDTLIENHIKDWEHYWLVSDIHFSQNPELTHAQRFNLYHLRIPVYSKSQFSIGARALTGRTYEGHVFWDAEIFILPAYLYTFPEIARQLLIYRFNTLDGARKRAKDLGYEGACFAWESTLSGLDVTPKNLIIGESKDPIPIFTGTQQIHVTADIVYAIYQYWETTLDIEFMKTMGVEIIFETARFWASRVSRKGPLFQIKKVVGPDEYHYDVNNNAFTNWMARFNLNCANWVYSWILKHDSEYAQYLFRKLGITPRELKNWVDIAERIVAPNINSDGVVEQFDGFFRLRDVTLPAEEQMKTPIHRLYAWQEINQMKINKQADVLMIPFLFPHAFTQEQLLANFLYYEPMTDHGSSLSLGVSAAIAARAGLRTKAREYWEKSLHLDLKNSMNNTSYGIHIGSIGATWQALVFHMLDIEISQEGLNLSNEPVIPRNSGGIDLKLLYQGTRYRFRYETGLSKLQKRIAA